MKIETIPVGRLEANCHIVSDDLKNAILIDTGAEPERILQIMNQAPSNRFDLDVAQNFVNSLSY